VWRSRLTFGSPCVDWHGLPSRCSSRCCSRSVSSTGNGGSCYGDSGGPNFFNYDGTRLLAAITITSDTPCRSTNVDYRLDTDSARSFLGGYVTLL
jgi:hypothetical protein